MQFPPNFPDCTIFLLAKAYQSAHAKFKKRLSTYHLTNLQHLVLEALWYQNGQTAAELRKMLILDKATLSGVLDRMSEADWIFKVQSSEDKRIVRVFPTEKANALKKPLIKEREKANTALLAPLSIEEQVLLKRMLKDLI